MPLPLWAGLKMFAFLSRRDGTCVGIPRVESEPSGNSDGTLPIAIASYYGDGGCITFRRGRVTSKLVLPSFSQHRQYLHSDNPAWRYALGPGRACRPTGIPLMADTNLRRLMHLRRSLLPESGYGTVHHPDSRATPQPGIGKGPDVTAWLAGISGKTPDHDVSSSESGWHLG